MVVVYMDGDGAHRGEVIKREMDREMAWGLLTVLSRVFKCSSSSLGGMRG